MSGNIKVLLLLAAVIGALVLLVDSWNPSEVPHDVVNKFTGETVRCYPGRYCPGPPSAEEPIRPDVGRDPVAGPSP